MARKKLPAAQRAVEQTLASLARSGVTHLPRKAAARKSVSSPAVERELAAPQASRPGLDSLEIIQREVAGCTRCKELASTRTHTVFGEGNPQPRLCFMGEAPGADEDESGRPFVGRAGQLLTNIITGCGMQREEVFILNTLKCRPPGNRTPLPTEVANCREYFDRQMALLRPEFICCLGTTAAQSLLQTDTTIGKLRGKFFEHAGAKVLCTYHPSYLLRNPAAKADVWEDMKLLLKAMGLPIPRKK